MPCRNFVGSQTGNSVSILIPKQSDPTTGSPAGKPLEAGDPKILDSVIGPNGIHLATADEHHANWLDCVRTRKTPLAPAEIAHRASCTTSP